MGQLPRRGHGGDSRAGEILALRGRTATTLVAALLVASGCGDEDGASRTAIPLPGAPGGGAACKRDSLGLTPLTDLRGGEYKGVPGGLYPGRSNRPPERHLAAGVREARAVQPLDDAGRRADDGAYALLSIGSSIASAEFRQFQHLVEQKGGVAAPLVLVNGAQSGVVADYWDDPAHPAWSELDARLGDAGVSAEQVAVAWVELIDRHSQATWPADAEQMRAETKTIVRLLRERFPNLRLAYLSSVRYNGYVVEPVSPEPVVYESAFGIRGAIEDQIAGDPALSFESGAAPWLAWGPYLWADGTKARRDGLKWECRDFFRDGLHPSARGAFKVAQELYRFLRSDPTARVWFTGR